MGDRPVKLLFHSLQLVWGENGSVRMESELDQYTVGTVSRLKIALLYTEYSSGMYQKMLKIFLLRLTD
jgi:hypothetical protein